MFVDSSLQKRSNRREGGLNRHVDCTTIVRPFRRAWEDSFPLVAYFGKEKNQRYKTGSFTKSIMSLYSHFNWPRPLPFAEEKRLDLRYIAHPTYHKSSFYGESWSLAAMGWLIQRDDLRRYKTHADKYDFSLRIHFNDPKPQHGSINKLICR